MSKLKILNTEPAQFDCVFPVCGGVCCKNGRPALEPAEIAAIQGGLPRFLPHLRPEAQKHVERNGFMTRRMKEGKPMLSVVAEWCVFFNEGCVLHKVGATEGDHGRYKPWVCVTFPLAKKSADEWYVRQWGYRGEAWDLFCLNPQESPRPAEQSLAYEIGFAERLAHGDQAWRLEKPPEPGEPVV